MEPSADLCEDKPDCGREGVQQRVVELWSYQYGLRLRHLRQVVGRNLQSNGNHPTPIPAFPLPAKRPRPQATVGYYFSLHAPSSKEEIFSSELQSASNPNWLDIDPETITPVNLQSLRGVLVRLWFKPKGEAAQLITSWGVHLSGLIPIGEVLPYDQEKYKPNTLVFKLRHVFYTAPDCYQHQHQAEQEPLPSLRFGFPLPLSETKLSYTVTALSRLHSTKRANRQQEIRCQETQEILEMQGVTRTSRSHVLGAQVEDCRMRVALLRDQLEEEIDKLRALKLSTDNLDNQNQEKGLELLEGYQGLHRQLGQVRTLSEVETTKREDLRESSICLGKWRKELIAQLPIIYPITQDSDGKYRICGVYLPDAERYDGLSERVLSVALGYVAHILVLLSQLLHLPLRYPLRPYGSTATIKDTASQQLGDTEREFPLYTGGKEREKLHFNYGVFLLNKNIAQMRWYCGIPTPDLRPTLANLHFLLAKLSQASTMGNQPPSSMPDVMMPVSARVGAVNLEVRTPSSLLQQQRSPRLPLNPLAAARSASQEYAKDALLDEEEDSASQWKVTKSSSETNSSDVSPVKTALYVREAAPLTGDSNTGKFIFVDKVQNTMGHIVHKEQSLEDRLSHTNGFSFSLDDGLNLIGEDQNSYKIKELTSCDDLNLLSNVSKSLNYSRGSEPSLLPNADVSVEEDILTVFKEQTTELLRSWHEDDPSHYTGALEAGSSERLEEVGEECDESFMCSSEHTQNSSRINLKEKEERENLLPSEQPEQNSQKTAEPLDTSNTDQPVDVTESKKTSETTKNAEMSLSEFGITEDMFLNDVAFRTAALASQNRSFKMSFSRQSTEDEYH